MRAGRWIFFLTGWALAMHAGASEFPVFEGEKLVKGREIWLGTCQACHGEGFADAPPVANRTAWAPRVAKGKDTLYQHALGGFFGANGAMMPPRGGNAALSDEEVRMAVDYMVELVTR